MENKKYFYGNEISGYGVQHNRVDYAALAKAFDAVLCNNITKLFYSTVNGEYNEVEQVHGFIDNSEEIEELQNRIKNYEQALEEYYKDLNKELAFIAFYDNDSNNEEIAK